MQAFIPSQSGRSVDFREGILHFGNPWPDFDRLGAQPAISEGRNAPLNPGHPDVIFQTLLAADALRYLTLQVTAAKASGHPGGFASIAEAVAALVMSGYKNILTEVGHHAPGFYSFLFLDRSLEKMGIRTVSQFCDRFRERGGLLGHPSGLIPGFLNPAGPLGQGQHFALAAALLNRDRLFPVTIGDGGLGEPYVMSALHHFATAFPEVTNYLPILVWNGHSQEHHSMVSTRSNQQMVEYWAAHGFRSIQLIDAGDFKDPEQSSSEVSQHGFFDSTRFPLERRLAFTGAVLEAVREGAAQALGGVHSVIIVKQLKGAGVHVAGAKAHNLFPGDTLSNSRIVQTLKKLALPKEAWQTVRINFERAGGGPASEVVVTERETAPVDVGNLRLTELPVGKDDRISTTMLAELACQVGERDRHFLVTNADGNEASGMANLNQKLGILHPTTDPLYHQNPRGQVYEPVSEDACAGLAGALSLMGGRSLWCSYESFAVNGLPVWQTVTQAMAELRRNVPSTVVVLTAGALEQGRNGWTHQRPEIENYLVSLMRNGNVFVLFPPDANAAQVCYQWALQSWNKGIAIVAGKSPLPVHLTLDQARRGLAQGGVTIEERGGGKRVVLAVAGDIVLEPALKAASELHARGFATRVVSVLNPRRLYRAQDVCWESCREPDGDFVKRQVFESLFGGDALLAISAGATGVLEPLLLRSRAPREVIGWKRGETTASPSQLMQLNGLTEENFVAVALELLSS